MRSMVEGARRSSDLSADPSTTRFAGGPPPPKGEVLGNRSLDRHGLDAGWDRRLARGLVAPDFTLDLHGATLDAAHSRLEHGLTLALAQHARLVLLITGRDRPSDDRRSRGAIRRKFMDWLAAGPHAQAECKSLIARVARGPVDDAMVADTAARIARVRVSAEGREGIAAFLSKRKPGWVSGGGT